MAIHKVDNGFVISSGGTWLPGVYEDERTARYAFRLDADALARLRDAAVTRGTVITWGDIARERGLSPSPPA